jgi:hypothetical protein
MSSQVQDAALERARLGKTNSLPLRLLVRAYLSIVRGLIGGGGKSDLGVSRNVCGARGRLRRRVVDSRGLKRIKREDS